MSPVTVVPEYGLAQISLEDPEFMRTLAEQAAEELADAPAEEVIRWAVDTFGERICITSSMTDAVIIHLASAVKPGYSTWSSLTRGTTSRRRSAPGTRFSVVYPIRLIRRLRRCHRLLLLVHVRADSRLRIGQGAASFRGRRGGSNQGRRTSRRLGRSGQQRPGEARPHPARRPV